MSSENKFGMLRRILRAIGLSEQAANDAVDFILDLPLKQNNHRDVPNVVGRWYCGQPKQERMQAIVFGVARIIQTAVRWCHISSGVIGTLEALGCRTKIRKIIGIANSEWYQNLSSKSRWRLILVMLKSPQ